MYRATVATLSLKKKMYHSMFKEWFKDARSHILHYGINLFLGGHFKMAAKVRLQTLVHTQSLPVSRDPHK